MSIVKSVFSCAFLFVFGIFIFISQIDQANATDSGYIDYDCEDCPRQPVVPPPPPPPPPPVVVVPTAPITSSSDDEDHRRISSLMSCCIRRAAGLGYGGSGYCNKMHLNRAISRGEIHLVKMPSGKNSCVVGSGVLGGQSLLANFSVLQSLFPAPSAQPRAGSNTQSPPTNILNFVLSPLFGSGR